MKPINIRMFIIYFLLIFALFIPTSLESCKRSRSYLDHTAKNESPERNHSSQKKTSKENTKGVSDKKIQELKKIYEDTINYWQYDETAYSYNYTPQQRLQSGRGICWDYALYFYNECKKKGLNNVHFVVSVNLKHGWNEVWEDNTVYIIDATWGDTNPYESIDKYFMVNASFSKEHYENDICVVDDTMEENDISSLYQGIIVQDAKRQKYTAARPIVKLKN
jgi:hypothetical protein